MLALIIPVQLTGEVLELADRRDLGLRAATREGSTPSFPIFPLIIMWYIEWVHLHYHARKFPFFNNFIKEGNYDSTER